MPLAGQLYWAGSVYKWIKWIISLWKFSSRLKLCIKRAYWPAYSVWFWLLDLRSRHGAFFCHPPLAWVTWAIFIRLGNAEFKPRFCSWLQTGRFAEIGDRWFALDVNASWRKITNGKQNYHVLPRRNLEAIGAVGANLGPFSFGGSRLAVFSLEFPTLVNLV